MMRLDLIGIGVGNLDQLTGQARSAIAEAELILIPQKGSGKEELALLRNHICKQLAPRTPIGAFNMPVRDENIADYHQRVSKWHYDIAETWADVMAQFGAPKRVALLVWGDPCLYDSTLRIARYLRADLQLRVIPGLTSVQLLCAAFSMPLNSVGEGVLITTGRNIRDGKLHGVSRAVVMLDGENSFQTLPPDALIYWAAYVGMPQQILISGRIGEVLDEIVAKRAAAKIAHGWIMDIYLVELGTPLKSF